MSKKETTAKRITTKQRKFLDVFPKKLCNIAQTCKSVEISRETFYRWYDNYDNFKKEIDEARENTYDDLESKLYKLALVDENPTILIFMAKTKMKERGYIEKQEMEHQGNDPFLEAMKEASKARRQQEGNE